MIMRGVCFGTGENKEFEFTNRNFSQKWCLYVMKLG